MTRVPRCPRPSRKPQHLPPLGRHAHAARWWCYSPNGLPTASGVQARGTCFDRVSTTSSRLSWWPHGLLWRRPTAGWRPPTCSPRSTATEWCRTPSATASVTTSTEGRDRSIRFPLTGKATPMHSPALPTCLVAFRPPPDSRSSPQPPTSCRGLWAVCHPWRQGGRHGWRSPVANSAAADEAAA